MRSVLVHTAIAGVVLALGGLGCIPAKTSLEGKNCDEQDRCAEGYFCNVSTNTCVPGDPPADGGSEDGGTADGGDDGGTTDGGGGDGGSDGGSDGGPCSGPEICNLLDDNCDGQTDEGLTDWDADGFCEEIDCDDREPRANPSQGEVCDGIDNNCDTVTDEFDLAVGTACDMAPASGVLGECVHGTTVCIAGFLECEASAPASGDLCGTDDDCDGSTDYPPPPGDLSAATVSIDMGGLSVDTSGVRDVYPLGAPDGAVQIRANLTPDTRYLELADAEAAVSWHFITPGHGPRTGPVLEVGVVGSGAGVELADGLHLVQAVYTDPCGSGEEVQEFVLEVGSPTGSSKPGGESNFRTVCVDPAGARVWVGSDGSAHSLQTSLTPISSDPVSNLRGCTVGPGGVGFFGRSANGDRVYRYDDPTDLSIQADVTVDNNDGIIELGIAAVDGRRPWIVSENKLKFHDGDSPGNFVEAGGVERAPDGGNVTCVIRESDTALWVCTADGVNRLDLSSFDPGTPSVTSTWAFTSSLTIFDAAGQGANTRADALTYSGGVLWAATRDTSDDLVRFDADAYRACATSGCALTDHVTAIDLSGNAASPQNKTDAIRVWSDGDLMIGSGNGLMRLQYCAPADNCRTMMLELHLDDVRDVDRLDAAGLPWSLYVAVHGGSGEVFRYRGE